MDEPAAKVVRYIFQLCIEGLGPTQIANRLEDEKVVCPTAYYMSIGQKTSNPMPKRGEYAWETSTIKHILANRQYTGCMVNFKTTLVSYKVHKMVHNPEEEWQIIPNPQEAIIDEDTFNRVQELRNELTPEIVNRLIKRIEVHNSEKVDGRKRVKLDVYFTAAGLIDIPDENELREMMEEIRKSA